MSDTKESVVNELLNSQQYSFLCESDKRFICAFNDRMEEMGYTCDDKIVDGVCFGKYMMIFTKKNVKTKKVYARLYLRTNGVVLRLFLNDVSKHALYIDASPEYIKEVFIGDYANCDHCRGDVCKFRKSYTINNIDYEKCNGLTFEFHKPAIERLDSYIELFSEFNCSKRNKAV